MLLRFLAMWALPQLSDDYFRFIWDGLLLSQGENPFALLPSEWMQQPDRAAELGLREALFEGMNSPDYFTIYPPVLQAIFGLAAWMFPSNTLAAVWVMKGFIFVAEGLSLLLLVRLLRIWNMPVNWIAIYALNPLIIIEFCGSLHFEALMILGLLMVLWMLAQGWSWGAILPFAFAVDVKLLPLMLLPVMVRYLGWLRAILFGLGVIGVSVVMFLPLFEWETFTHLGESVDLYFQSFEFNASLYYVVREVGYVWKGYNIIGIAGRILPIIVIAGIAILSLRREAKSLASLPVDWLAVFSLYFALASIVHPWYSGVLVALASLGRYLFPIIWTVLLPLTYAAYRTDQYAEELWLVFIEYAVVYSWAWLEWRNRSFAKDESQDV
ncbi:hypothetical protein [Pontibacter sp. G13]|uniref:hypothetical protein n=1 Tax=Pontibacter sp. G13 TaxID=3074898 RepID=UPI00288ADF68|nr:hypothetical protein [Pontibacter sp. G13]WNJ16093.1 hypothetical protein RJD25_14615 [Pontibacter sp. G13]